jgi:hypothetical protein
MEATRRSGSSDPDRLGASARNGPFRCVKMVFRGSCSKRPAELGVYNFYPRAQAVTV